MPKKSKKSKKSKSMQIKTDDNLVIGDSGAFTITKIVPTITVTSPLPGTIYDIKVKKGDKVKGGQPLIKLVAMKMENEITAKKAGTVKEIKVKKNDTVNKGDVLIIID